MFVTKMHADEVDTSVPLVRRLLAAQFPHWADLPIEPIRSAGTDNAIYRLGAKMAVRLPRMHDAAGQVDKEHRWLPKLVPLLRLSITVPLAKGTPGEDYPFAWSVYPWLEGENADHRTVRCPVLARISRDAIDAALAVFDPAAQYPAHPQLLKRYQRRVQTESTSC